VLEPTARYRLDPQVALRPEPFGALAYHYGSRRLTFLRSAQLASMVRRLDDYESVEDALMDVSPADRESYRRALAALEESRFIHAC
jgi:putative mycofactocin binding protein MftB